MNEIRRQPVLRLFGSLLALTHILTALFWLNPSLRYVPVFTDKLPLCWPFLNGCEAWPRFTPISLFVVLGVYSVLAAVTGMLFFKAKWTNAAVAALAVLSLIKLILFLLDYRLSGNYHYMHFWVLAAFLLIPQKALTIRFLLMGFYLGAGLLKLNQEWLSGAALPPNIFLSGIWLKLACGYVVILELILIFGLLNRKRAIFWLTLAQLFLFHTFSFFIVGFYYPSLLFCFLMLFVMCERETPGDFRWQRLRELKWPSRIFLAVFVLLQVLPFLLGGDRAVDGRGRLLALNMFDAGTMCNFEVKARFKDRTESLAPQYSPQLEPRLYCDPHVMLADARHRCRQLHANPDFIDLDIQLQSKRRTDMDYRKVFAFQNFCASPKYVDVFGLIR